MMKKVQAVLLSLGMLSGFLAGLKMPADVLAAQGKAVSAGTKPPEQFYTGRLAMEEKEAAFTGQEKQYESGAESSLSREKPRGAIIYRSEWDKYKNYYFYNQMSGPERAYWDKLDDICMKYMTTQADANKNPKGDSCYTDALSSDSLTVEEMKEVLTIFRYANPQYYFINNVIWTLSSGDRKALAFGIYPAFADGAARAAETGKVKVQIAAWQSQIDACGSEEEKVKKIHDLIVEKVDYNHAINQEGFDESTQYSQSAYSVFCMDQTVCAGYAQSFAMMCNGSGIDAVAVTSLDHEWNKVRVGDSWYNVDCTWDDQSTITYWYFERNDYFYDVLDGGNRLSHKEEDYWEEYLPVCSLDSDPPSYSLPGTLPSITEATSVPVIEITESGGTRSAAITCDTAGADIYYSLDGTDPAPASVKCMRYTQPFAADAAEIRAVAVCDARRDSGVAVSGKDGTVSGGAGGNGGAAEGGGTEDSAGGGGTDSGTGGTETHRRDLTSASVRLPQTSYDYSGKAKKPKVTVVLDGKELTSGTDYTVSYRNNKNIGTAVVIVTGRGAYTGSREKNFSIKAKKGSVFAVKEYKYKITGSAEAAFAGLTDTKTTKVVIPASVKIGGRSFKVTSIADKALQKKKKVKSVTIGNNVKTIGNQAFSGCTNLASVTIGKGLTKIGREAFLNCKKLGKLTIKSTKVKSVGKNAFRGIRSDAAIKVPSKKLKEYKRLFKGKGQGSRVQIGKI